MKPRQRFTTWGPVRGLAGQGGYSDRDVYAVGTDGYLYRDLPDPHSWITDGAGGPGVRHSEVA